MTKSKEITLAETFKEWRELANYKRVDCARIFKVSLRTIENWDCGRQKPPQAVIICLQLFSSRLDFLGVCRIGFNIPNIDCPIRISGSNDFSTH